MTVFFVKNRAAVAGHVDSGGAISGAPFARHAQVQCPFHLGRVPAVNKSAVDHFLEHAGSATRGINLEPGRLVRGTHHPARGGRGDALAHPGTAMNVGGEFRVGNGHGGKSRFVGPYIGLHRRRIHQNTWVKQVIRVENGLDLGEQRQGVGGIHQVQQGRAGPAVTMLPGDRTSMPSDQPGGFGDEGAVAPGAVWLI